MATKNLGQVAAIWLGTSAPENTSLIWFDTTPAIRKHKVYDEDLADWVVLDNDAISAITYSELQTLAQDPGLTLGSWYRITDPEYANTLALAITSTKIKYVDINNNLIIDDLAGSKTYVVNSSNLTIDEIAGTWDALQKKLNFPFSRSQAVGADRGDELLLAERTVNETTEFAAYTFRSLVSSHSANSLQWTRNGIFFNFVAAVSNIINVNNGVVGYNQYQIDISNLNQALGDIAQAVASSIEANQQYTDGAIEALNIYAREIPNTPSGGINPPSGINAGDSLSTICQYLQFWLIRLSGETNGLKVNSGYTPRAFLISPGTTTLTNWMENMQWEAWKSSQSIAIVRTEKELVLVGDLFQTENAVVLVKRKSVLGITLPYVISDEINLTNLYLNKGTLIFEPGTVIELSNFTGYFRNYDDTDASYSSAYKRGKIIGNGCLIKTTLQTGASQTCFYNCHNISGFKFQGSKKCRIYKCHNVSDCNYAIRPTTDDENGLYIDTCYRVSDCSCTKIETCSFVQGCEIYNPTNQQMAVDNFFMIFNFLQGNGVISNCYSDENTTPIGPSAAGGFNHIPE